MLFFEKYKMLDKKIVELLKEYWTILSFFTTVIIYMIGYIKVSFFLQEFNVLINPTDVYSNISLFASGLTTIVAGLSIPCISVVIGILIYYCITSPKMNDNKPIIFGILLCLTLIAFWCHIDKIPGNLFVLPLVGYLLGDDYVKLGVYSLVVITFVQIFASISYFFYKKKKYFLSQYKSYINERSINYDKTVQTINSKLLVWKLVLICAIFAWFSIFLISQIATFSKLKTIPIGLVQLSGVRGVISTEIPISTQSKKIQIQGKTYFDTHGILINIADNTYYFIPLDEKNSTSIAMLPSVKVLGFCGTW